MYIVYTYVGRMHKCNKIKVPCLKLNIFKMQ